MLIQDGLHILKTQLMLKRTPKGRPITNYALQCLESVMGDEKNYQSNLVKCKNCGFVISSLLVEEGCPNCNYLELDEITEEGQKVIRRK